MMKMNQRGQCGSGLLVRSTAGVLGIFSVVALVLLCYTNCHINRAFEISPDFDIDDADHDGRSAYSANTAPWPHNKKSADRAGSTLDTPGCGQTLKLNCSTSFLHTQRAALTSGYRWCGAFVVIQLKLLSFTDT